MPNRTFILHPQNLVGESGWTLVGGGTVPAALSKNGVMPGTGETPPTTNEPRIISATNGAVTAVGFGTVGSYSLLKEIDELLKAGGTVTAVRLDMYGENRSTTGKPVKLAWITKTSEPEWSKLVAAWAIPLAMTEAELLAKADTAEHLATALKEVVFEKKTVKETWIWELQVEVVVKEAAKAEIPLNSAASTSSTSAQVTAPTKVPLNGAAAESATVAAFNAPTQIPLVAASSASSDSLALSAPTKVPLNPGASASSSSIELFTPRLIALNPGSSASASSLALSAPTQIPLQTAASSSSTSLSLSAPTQVSLAAASAASAATLALTANTIVLLSPAAAQAAASMTLQAPTSIVLAPALSESATQPLGVRAKTIIPLQSATAESSAPEIKIFVPGAEEPFGKATSVITVVNDAESAITSTRNETTTSITTVNTADSQLFASR